MTETLVLAAQLEVAGVALDGAVDDEVDGIGRRWVIWSSQSAKTSRVRVEWAEKLPMTPREQAASAISGDDTRNIGTAMSGMRRLPPKVRLRVIGFCRSRASGSDRGSYARLRKARERPQTAPTRL